MGEEIPTDPKHAGPPEEIIYRFPYGRAAVEIVPDLSDTFCLRLFWHKGKTVLPLFESTALRPLAEATLDGQTFPLFLSRHTRQRRERILLAGRRKIARSARASLRFGVSVEAREDKFTWRWRVAAAAARGVPAASSPEEAPHDDAVRLSLPFSPGRAGIIALPSVGNGLAVWMKDIAVTVVISPVRGVVGAAVPELVADSRGVHLTLHGAALLSGSGIEIGWETWLCPARTEDEAHAALVAHLADATDRAQEQPSLPLPVPDDEAVSRGFLTRLARQSTSVLMADESVEKRTADRLTFRAAGATDDNPPYQVNGEGADAALAANALLGRYFLSGDDALRRRARLLGNGVCDFQINTEESQHWGALWDAVRGRQQFSDIHGERTLSVATTARAAQGLHRLHAHFETPLLARTALGAAQWLLLKMSTEGFIAGERFHENGLPISANGSFWVMCEALLPLVESFRRTGNEVFLKAALRIVGTTKRELQGGGATGRLSLEQATTEQLAAAVEGILAVSREYESDEMIALARRIAAGLRLRRLPDGSLKAAAEPQNPQTPVASLSPTLAGARAALALARVDDDPLWPLLALRALRAGGRVAQENPASVTIADHAALCSLPTGLLLTIAARAASCTADRDLLTILRGWQTFQPEPLTRDYVRVEAEGGDGAAAAAAAVDYLALVCPVSLQVLIAVLAPPGVSAVNILKNNRRPFVKNLLTGEYDLAANLIPLDAHGSEAMIGVFLADT